MEDNTFNPFDSIGSEKDDIETTSKVERSSSDGYDDDLGFDVDELVRKIDAKIAELEEEEKRQNEMKNKNDETKSDESIDTSVKEAPADTQPVNSINNIYDDSDKVVNQNKTIPIPSINLDDGDDDDDFFDDFFDN